MRHLTAIAALIMLVAASEAAAQRSRSSTRKPAPPPPPKVEPAQVKCAETLGVGVKTGATYCFVLAGSDPENGVRITIPPHVNTATLLFDHPSVSALARFVAAEAMPDLFANGGRAGDELAGLDADALSELLDAELGGAA